MSENEPNLREVGSQLREFGLDAPHNPTAESPKLRRAVEAFQELAGLPVTGFLTQEVQRKLAARPALSQGDSGAAVQLLQHKLNGKGFRLRTDGQFSLWVTNALLEWQGRVGIARTGRVDDETWETLN